MAGVREIDSKHDLPVELAQSECVLWGSFHFQN